MAAQDPAHSAPLELMDFVKSVAAELEPSHERREHERYHLTVPVDVQPLNEDFEPMGEAFVAVTRDFSAVGIGLLHTRAVTAKYLQLTIRAAEEPKRLTLQVLRCQSIGRFYDIGGQFVARP